MANASSKISKRVSAAKGKILKFPEELGEMSRNAHFVSFYINYQSKTEIKFPAAGGNALAKLEGGVVQESRYQSTTAGKNFGDDKVGSTLSIPRAPTKRMAGCIQLFMPNQLQVTHKANYGEPEIGLAAASVTNMISKISSDKDDFSLSDFMSGLGSEASDKTASALEGAGATGAKAIERIATGRLTVNRSEVMFEGIDRRAFTFTFLMLPKTQEEADTIEKIVTQFRFHSMPEISKESSRTMIPPSTFDIEYTPDEHLHRISTCVCESVDVQYGGDRTQFFRDNHPVQTQLTLTFKELEIITKQRIEEGF